MNPWVAPEMIFLVSNKGSDAPQGLENFCSSFPKHLFVSLVFWIFSAHGDRGQVFNIKLDGIITVPAQLRA